jgi:PAS domain S-box-containing protein
MKTPSIALQRNLIVGLVLVVGALVTLVAWQQIDRQLKQAEEQRFQRYNERVVSTIKERLKNHERLLESGRGLFYASDSVTRSDWRTFSQSMTLTSYPGILGVGYIEHVPRSNLAGYLSRQRAEAADFQLKTGGWHDNLFVITYIEPLERNLPARGLDIGQERNRREAAEQAAATGLPILTRRITLAQDQKKVAGFLMLLPIYRTLSLPKGLDDRRAALQGWVYVPVRIEELMNDIADATDRMLDFEVVEGEVDDTRALLYDTDQHLGGQGDSAIGADRFADRAFHRVTQIQNYGRTWRIHTSTLPEFDRSAADSLWVIPIGLVLTLMGTVLAWTLAQARGKAQALADAMTIDLRQRIREISCLSAIRRDQPRELDVETYCRRVIGHLIEHASQPGAVGVVIELDGQRYASEGQVTAPLSGLRAAIRVEGERVGELALFHAEDQSKQLQAEQELLDAIADTIGNWLARHRAKESLKASARHTQAILDNVVDGIITIDEHGTVTTLNKAAERIFGHAAGEVVGRNVNMLMPEPYHSEHDGYLRNYLATGKKKIIGSGREVEGLRSDGNRFPMDLAITELMRDGQRLFIGLVRDISERRRIEKMKGEFVSTVSHELRTPLTAIRGALGLLAGGALGPLPEQARQLADLALKNSERLGLLIDDLLDMEKIAARQLSYDLQVRELMPLVEQALQANLPYAEPLQVRFTLAERVAGAHVKVDAQRLLQVLSNFLSNAAKFSPPGSEVTVAVRREGDALRVSVRDHGPGIPAEFHERIFQKFSQADASDTRAKGGTGLGLAITKELVEHMGGEVGFESTPGQGATFFFVFKECPPSADMAEQE